MTQRDPIKVHYWQGPDGRWYWIDSEHLADGGRVASRFDDIMDMRADAQWCMKGTNWEWSMGQPREMEGQP